MLRVLKPGLHTSIQDLGRFGFRNFGVPVSGAMDTQSAKTANLILGNDEGDAVMEITLQGPKLHFENETKIAITGADLSPSKNGYPLKKNTSFEVQKGDVLDFGKRKFGVRSYLSVTGGFQTASIFGSKSFYDGITDKEKMEAGDEIKFEINSSNKKFTSIELSLNDLLFNDEKLEVFHGPEFDKLTEIQKQFLLSNSFTLGMNNRMAYQIKETLPNDLKPILSSAVFPGTVQLTPSGKLIILMRDCQTTGGYPRVLQLSEASVNHLAQKMQLEKIQFKLQENLGLS